MKAERVQVQASNSSSSVPIPPGSATNASASSAICALRSCMVVDDVQLGQAGVRDLAVDQRLRDDADSLAAGLEHCVGDDAHQAELPAAVDEPEAARRSAASASASAASR